MSKNLYSTFQAAKTLGVSPGTVLNWIKSGKVPASRTLGGHYRIQGDTIDELIAERNLHNLAGGIASPHKTFQYCWEFNSKGGELPNDCRNCLAYKTRARRCYELSVVPKQFGHMKLFCDSVCEDCDYFLHVKDQVLNILVVTDDDGLMKAFENDEKTFNVRKTDSEYECSTIVEKLRPDIAVIDCSFPRSKDLLECLTNDPRVPHLKMVLISDTEIASDYRNNKIIARISKPLTTERIEKLFAR